MYWIIKDKDQIYWLFSSSLQSIAAFVAILLTGYAFVVNIMDGLEAKDPTKAVIHKELKYGYYRELKILAILACLSLVTSIIMLYVNAYENWVRTAFIAPSFLGVVGTIIYGVYFIVKIVDPSKYEKKAAELLEKENITNQVSGGKISALVFLEKFINIEKRIRLLYERFPYRVIDGNTNRTWPLMLSEIASVFLQNELLDRKEVDQMKEVFKVRNLVVHGKKDEIEKGWMDKLSQIEHIISLLEARLEDRTLQDSNYKRSN